MIYAFTTLATDSNWCIGNVSQAAIFYPMLKWSKAAAMYWASAMFFEGCHVTCCAVALVLCKVVLWPLLVILLHHLVPGHLHGPIS